MSTSKFYLIARLKDENLHLIYPFRIPYSQDSDVCRNKAVNTFMGNSKIRACNAAHIFVEFPANDRRAGVVFRKFEYNHEVLGTKPHKPIQARLKMVYYDQNFVRNARYSDPILDKIDPDAAAWALWNAIRKDAPLYRLVTILEQKTDTLYVNRAGDTMNWVFGRRVHATPKTPQHE